MFMAGCSVVSMSMVAVMIETTLAFSSTKKKKFEIHSSSMRRSAAPGNCREALSHHVQS